MTTFTFGILFDGYDRKSHDEDGFEFNVRVDLFVVGASTQSGRNYVLGNPAAFETEAEAIEAMNALDHDPATRPDLWFEGEPTYGSEAWDSEAEYGLACFEADCFNEPRPRW